MIYNKCTWWTYFSHIKDKLDRQSNFTKLLFYYFMRIKLFVHTATRRLRNIYKCTLAEEKTNKNFGNEYLCLLRSNYWYGSIISRKRARWKKFIIYSYEHLSLPTEVSKIVIYVCILITRITLVMSVSGETSFYQYTSLIFRQLSVITTCFAQSQVKILCYYNGTRSLCFSSALRVLRSPETIKLFGVVWFSTELYQIWILGSISPP